MKAITTKYAGPTNSRGSRIIVKAEGCPSRQYGCDDELNVEENHIQAAKAYRNLMGWSGEMLGGGLPDSTGYCFCFAKSHVKVEV